MISSPNPIIQVGHVTKRYPGVVALDDVSLDIRTGELHAICGENGAGKSTLMKILAGVETSYSGEILIHGKRIAFQGTKDAEASGVSIIHQELNLVEQLSAAANIFLGREIRTAWGLLDQRRMDRQAAELLGQLECSVHPQQLAGTMRVGDQQLVEIAKAVSLHNDILIMDEPTSALTEGEVERLYRVIATLRKQGVTILYISHKMDEVFRLADRISVLRDGKHVKTVDKSATSPREITHLMVGREIEAGGFHQERTVGDVVLSLEHLSLPWPGHARQWRLHDISFDLRRGEVLGIAGLMGAGRTELLETIFGNSEATPSGTIRLNGTEIRFQHPAEAVAQGIALVTEDRKRTGLFHHFDVGENVSLIALPDASTGNVIHRRRENQMALQCVQDLTVKTPSLRVPITSLSGGNQQKAIIGRWLLTQPQVLLLDDPTRGVDVGAKAELYRLIDRLCRQGLGVIVTSSELPELLTLCDRILVLCEGRLTGHFSRCDATEQRIMEAATAVAGH